MVASSPVLDNHFTGFALYDATKGKMVSEVNSSLYFTPASNTKLFTFYTALNMLGDSIPALQYERRGDSLIFWGTADPTFLHPQLNAPKVWSFLRNEPGTLYFAFGRYRGDFYGTGWAYGDYNAYYQPEITEFPVYENCLHISSAPGGSVRVSPAAMTKNVHPSAELTGSFYVRRDLFSNDYRHPDNPPAPTYTQTVPMRLDTATLLYLLRDTLKRPVNLLRYRKPLNVQTIYSINSDTLYRHMLQPSDNFIAESILLLCAAANGMEMSTDSVIAYSTRRFLADLPDAPQWVDGSGLSRHDLFTPRDMVMLLRKIDSKVGDRDRLFGMLAIGGKAGTLRNIYKSATPFVFGKTGSLSNNHNQAGYILTKKGKVMMYSFMNNNFTAPTAAIRSEMERIVTWIHENY